MAEIEVREASKAKAKQKLADMSVSDGHQPKAVDLSTAKKPSKVSLSKKTSTTQSSGSEIPSTRRVQYRIRMSNLRNFIKN